MNPYERRIIHAAVSEVEGVRSESVGEGATRRVVILPEDMDLSTALRRSLSRRSDHRRGSAVPAVMTVPASPIKSRSAGKNAHRAVRLLLMASPPPRRTESINDGENLPLFGKVEL